MVIIVRKLKMTETRNQADADYVGLFSADEVILLRMLSRDALKMHWKGISE